MTTKKTIAIFGAGMGLGASLATRFGREGYRVALIARSAEPLEKRVAELAEEGIEAVAFPADLTDLSGIPALIRSIEEYFGSIDVAIYSPVPSNAGFVSAVDLDSAKLKSMTPIFTYAPVEVSHALLPGMLARGDGAIVLVTGVGPAMTAARNYILTLNAEVAGKGVFAGSVSIGAMIERSTGMRIATAGGATLDPRLPVIDPDLIAEEIRNLVIKRDRAEIILPAPPQS
jgi:short-subunit dehydrogenase